MEVLVRILLGLLLVAHGLVHLMWFVPNDDPAWPFRLDRSGLMSETTRKPITVALVALIVAGFALLGLAVWGVPGLASIWPGQGDRGRRRVTHRPGAVLGSSAPVGRCDRRARETVGAPQRRRHTAASSGAPGTRLAGHAASAGPEAYKNRKPEDVLGSAVELLRVGSSSW